MNSRDDSRGGGGLVPKAKRVVRRKETKNMKISNSIKLQVSPKVKKLTRILDKAFRGFRGGTIVMPEFVIMRTQTWHEDVERQWKLAHPNGE